MTCFLAFKVSIFVSKCSYWPPGSGRGLYHEQNRTERSVELNVRVVLITVMKKTSSSLRSGRLHTDSTTVETQRRLTFPVRVMLILVRCLTDGRTLTCFSTGDVPKTTVISISVMWRLRGR